MLSNVIINTGAIYLHLQCCGYITSIKQLLNRKDRYNMPLKYTKNNNQQFKLYSKRKKFDFYLNFGSQNLLKYYRNSKYYKELYF